MAQINPPRQYLFNGVIYLSVYNNPGVPGINGALAPSGRLSLSDTVADSDIAVSNTLYWTPLVDILQCYVWNRQTSQWGPVRVHGIPSVSNLATANLPYDIFIGQPQDGPDEDGAYTFALEKVAWTDATTRAVPLVSVGGLGVGPAFPGGRWAKSVGGVVSLYLGTVIAQPTDSLRYRDGSMCRQIYNEYNRLNFSDTVSDPTASWTGNATTTYDSMHSDVNALTRYWSFFGVAGRGRLFNCRAGANMGPHGVLSIGLNDYTVSGPGATEATSSSTVASNVAVTGMGNVLTGKVFLYVVQKKSGSEGDSPTVFGNTPNSYFTVEGSR